MSDRPHWADMLGKEIGWLTVCGWKAHTAEACRNSAKWHLWLAEGQGMASACDEHIALARDILELTDEHEWGQWCNLPGSIWMQQPPLSWCEQEHGDPLAQLESAPTPRERELVDSC